MNFQGKAVLVYLEEDNIARAYFRVQPLMTQDGPLGSMKADYPDDGFLRIVPDKNEQHTFKERMRTLSGLCLVDLRFFSADANKIRTNKNYSPTRGENNQFIVYSDAVRPIPDDLLYQVVSENGVNTAVTPQVYIRNGANIQGPFRRNDGQSAGETAKLPPDSAEIHSVTVNGQDLLLYWPRAAEPAESFPVQPLPEQAPLQEPAPAPAPAPVPVQAPVPVPAAEDQAAPEAPEKPVQPTAYEQIRSLNEQLSENANRLNAPSSIPQMDFIPEQNARPLTGTKLYQTPQRQLAPRRAHNPLMEAVENQRYASRFDTSRYEAPGATIPQNTELREVNNPAETLKRTLQSLSNSPEAQRQAADVILSQSGMRVMLSRALAQETNDLTLAAMHSQLQELEAERLMTLMQLDDAKKNLAAAREEALNKLNMAEQKKLDQLHIAQQTAQNAMDQLVKSMEPLEQKRREAADYLDAVGGSAEISRRFICPPAGTPAGKAELIERVEKCMQAAGFRMEEGDALAMLTAFALSADTRFWEIRSDVPADAEYALRAFAAALGSAPVIDTSLRDDFSVVPGGSAPVFILSSYQTVFHPLVFTTQAGKLGKSEDPDECWFTPRCAFPVYADEGALPQPLPEYSPVCLDSVLKEMLPEGTLTDETKAVIASLRKAAADMGYPIPLPAVEKMVRFIAAVQNECKGGVAEAIDRAAALYIAPHILEYGLDKEALKPHLAALPRTLKALKA